VSPVTVSTGAVIHHLDTFGVQDCTWCAKRLF
jgi:hypothetical protein